MPADTRPPVIALMGPTASGKSALALELAQRLDGEIVSVDSALVYRGLDIGAAKPTPAERAQIPHHMIDLREPWQPYSAADFAIDAQEVIAGIHARGRLPFLAGGTGLYFQALLCGLAPMPAADARLREDIAKQAAQRGWAALHGELAVIDPAAAARIRPMDAQRIQRALEVWHNSGERISDLQRAGAAPRPWRVLKLVIAPLQRDQLHARIAARFDAMLGHGFLDEVRALRGLPELRALAQPLQLPALRAVGYRQAWEALDASEVEPLRDRAIFATRQLAKRQLTWLRGQQDARWVDPGAQRPALDRAIALFLGR